MKNMIEWFHNLKKGKIEMLEVNYEKAREKLNSIWKAGNCTICGGSNWSMEDEMYTPLNYDKNKIIQISGKALPLFVLTCTNCGNTIFINGKVLGCVKEVNDDEAEELK